MKTNLQNAIDTHQPCVTGERGGRHDGVSTAQLSLGGRNRRTPRWPWGLARCYGSAPVFVLAMLGLSAALQAKTYEYFISDGRVIITAYTGPGGDVTIPEMIEGFPVTGIGDNTFRGGSLTGVTIPDSVKFIGNGAFSFCSSLASVTIPNSVTYLADSLFSYSSLAGLTIPDSVTFIAARAFSGCTNLASVTIPKSVTSIEDGTFSGCTSLASVTIPNSVTSIGNSAFSGCTSLASVTIPDSITFINIRAFSGCTSLVSVTIPNSVTSVSIDAFSGCTHLASITVDAQNLYLSSLDGVLFNKDLTALLEYPNGKSAEYIVPSNVTLIGSYAFHDCTSLASVTIPNSVKIIGDATFRHCTGLTRVTLPASVTSIGGGAFYDCSNLVSIKVDSGNPKYSSLDGVLFNKNRTALLQCPAGKIEEYMVPNSVTLIGVEAFYGCARLATVTIPNSVTQIDSFAFGSCTSLASITIPSSVTTLRSQAFSGCTKLRSVYFMGNAPPSELYVFEGTHGVTVYYRAGKKGWESIFEGRPAVLWIPEADLDRDGLTNEQEFLAGTDPLDAQSLLAFEGAARLNDLVEDDKTALQPGQFALYFQSVPGMSYVIEFTATLGAQWSPATTAASRATQKRVVLDRPATNGFYRLKLAAAQ